MPLLLDPESFAAALLLHRAAPSRRRSFSGAPSPSLCSSPPPLRLKPCRAGVHHLLAAVLLHAMPPCPVRPIELPCFARSYPLTALRLRATASGLPRSSRPSASLANPSPHRLGLAHGEATPQRSLLFFLPVGLTSFGLFLVFFSRTFFLFSRESCFS